MKMLVCSVVAFVTGAIASYAFFIYVSATMTYHKLHGDILRDTALIAHLELGNVDVVESTLRIGLDCSRKALESHLDDWSIVSDRFSDHPLELAEKYAGLCDAQRTLHRDDA